MYERRINKTETWMLAGRDSKSLITQKLFNNMNIVQTEIIPVIHMETDEQIKANVEICISCGIKKVFLINHHHYSGDIIQKALELKITYPNFWVGVNLLDRSAPASYSMELEGIDGLWCDETILPVEVKHRRKFKGMLFGGLAFKYQPQPSDLEFACLEASVATDVACTSGNGTGQEASLKKIKEIRKHLKNHPMAIASGVNSNNVVNYKGIANYLLVATSITGSNEMILKHKLEELMLLLNEKQKSI
jgi:hypothetical protein